MLVIAIGADSTFLVCKTSSLYFKLVCKLCFLLNYYYFRCLRFIFIVFILSVYVVMYVHMAARSVGSLGADVIDSSELCDVEKQFCAPTS